MYRFLPIQNFEGKSSVEFHACGTQQDSNCLCGSSLSTNHFTRVFRISPQFQDCNLGAFHCSDLNFVWIIDKSLRNFFKECFHVSLSNCIE